MRVTRYVIKDRMGIHARPASLLVREANKYESKITIQSEGKEANARGIIKLMGLGVRQGSEVIIVCEGEDEDIAIEAMERFFSENI